MANEQRVRGNLVSGTLSVGLSNVDTTMSSAGLANLPAVTATGHAVIVIENELVYVTAHTAAATTATITRGKEGTSAAAHSNGVAWVHGPVVSDFDSVLGYAQVTAAQTGITTAVDLTGLTTTVTVPYAQHRVRITGFAQFSNNTVTDGAVLSVLQDGVQVANAIGYGPVVNQSFTVVCMAVIVPTVASHTYKLQGAQAVGGTVSLAASATAPSFILVEDLGPAL